MAEEMKNCCYIPSDVLIEILSRLPVKSLLRLKIVCKLWYSLIKSPYFITKHLEQITLDDHRASLLILHHDEYDTSTPIYNKKDVISLFSNHTLDGPVRLKPDFKEPRLLEIMGPCNGIFCVHDDYENLFLWNPATREIKDIPEPPLPTPNLSEAIPFNKCGFGLDPKTNVYKVVVLGHHTYDEFLTDEYQDFVLYNATTHSWKKLNAVVKGALIKAWHPFGMYMNGFYHWLAEPSGPDTVDDGDLIISFDMSDEVFQITPIGKFWNKTTWGVFTEWNESLAVICSSLCEVERFIEIWKVSEYGSKAVWSKQFSIGPILGDEVPLGLWNNNRVFIMGNGYGLVMSYDPITQTSKVLLPSVGILGDDLAINVVKYKESLVSFSQ